MSDQPRLTERQAAMAVMRDRYRRGFCLPGYTPAQWWQCDVFEVTAGGYFREYEIKLTRPDFFADRLKRQGQWRRFPPDRPFDPAAVVTKHSLLSARSSDGPTRFWYVVPSGLIQATELPEWAGLIELTLWHGRWRKRVIVDAPQLHRQKLAESVVAHARGVCYWRMHSLLIAEAGRQKARPTVAAAE
jgi:hypothetical protein